MRPALYIILKFQKKTIPGLFSACKKRGKNPPGKTKIDLLRTIPDFLAVLFFGKLGIEGRSGEFFKMNISGKPL